MNIQVLKSKLHQVRITHADIEYEGSFGIDTELMELVGLYPYEKVLIANINNGNRLETYVIPEPAGSRRMVLNGAAARLGAAGDRAIIMSFCMVDEATLREGKHHPRIAQLDESNEPVSGLTNVPTFDEIASTIES